MISKLFIQNYAIIDQLEIHFEHGLNIITGETGAGKSILMGALNLILGQRADSNVLQDPQKKCIIEGLFKINKSQQVLQFFLQNELDFENEILIRREIAANGKSRSFINDTPVNLSQVKALSVHLVDLHQQFDTLEINSESFQRDVLDALSDHTTLLLEFKKQFEAYQQARKSLAQLRIEQAEANKELDYNQFLFSELEEISLKENELEDIESELKMLNNAERIKLQLSTISAELSNEEQPVINQLKTINNKLKLLVDFHPEVSNLHQRFNSAIIEVQDIADELERIESQVKYDEERISILNDRLSAGYKLLKKHGFSSTAQLISLKESLQIKLEAYTNVFSSIEVLEKSLVKLFDACTISAKQISVNRKKQIDGFVKEVNRLLAQVGMPNARLNVSITETELNMFGIDSIEFLFDANKSNKFEPIGKVASGGELSRLMLSIKSLVAQKLALPTLIFDEIDTGISGEAAKQVGLIMKSLSTSHQIIAITHQAQIAAKASTHFFVYKAVKGEKITTSIRILNEDERINAIAQMLSGEKPTTAAMENAKEMMSN